MRASTRGEVAIQMYLLAGHVCLVATVAGWALPRPLRYVLFIFSAGAILHHSNRGVRAMLGLPLEEGL